MSTFEKVGRYYVLAVNDDTGDIKPLDTRLFSIKDNDIVDSKSASLAVIDEYTMRYDNENTLLKLLYEAHKIDSLDYSLKIVYKADKEIRLVPMLFSKYKDKINPQDCKNSTMDIKASRTNSCIGKILSYISNRDFYQKACNQNYFNTHFKKYIDDYLFNPEHRKFSLQNKLVIDEIYKDLSNYKTYRSFLYAIEAYDKSKYVPKPYVEFKGDSYGMSDEIDEEGKGFRR